MSSISSEELAVSPLMNKVSIVASRSCRETPSSRGSLSRAYPKDLRNEFLLHTTIDGKNTWVRRYPTQIIKAKQEGWNKFGTNLFQISSEGFQVVRDGGVHESPDIRAEDPGREHETAAERAGPKDAVAKVAPRCDAVPPSMKGRVLGKVYEAFHDFFIGWVT